MTKNESKKSDKVIWLTVIGSYLGIFIPVISILSLDIIIKLILYSIIGVIYAQIIFLLKIWSDYKNYRKNKKFYDNMPLLIYSPKLKKEIIIHDEKGTATISYCYHVKNISDKTLYHIGRPIYFEGEFIENEFELKIDSKIRLWNDIKRFDVEALMPVKKGYTNQKFIKIEFKEDGIKKGESAYIDVKYKSENLYLRAFTDNKWDDTSFITFYPIDEIELIIKLELENYKINYDKFIIEQTDMKIEDLHEKIRFQQNNLIPKTPQDNKLVWKFTNPKIGHTYRIFFQFKEKSI